MALLSPGIETKEISLQTTIARASTGRAALVGKFNWGPAFEMSQVISEVDLVDRFGRPDDTTADSFFSGVNFLQYGNDLRVVRVVNEEFAQNASHIHDTLIVTGTPSGEGYKVGDTVNVYLTENGTQSIIDSGEVTRVNSNGAVVSVYVPTAKIVEKAIAIDDYPGLDGQWSIEAVGISVTPAQLSIGGLRGNTTIYFPNDDYAYDALTRLVSEPNASHATLCQYYNVPSIAARFPGELAGDLLVGIVPFADYYDTNGKAKTITFDVFPSGTTFGQINLASVLQYGPQTEDQFGFIVFRDGAVVESRVLSHKEGDRDIYGTSIFIDEYFRNGYSTFIQGVSAGWPKDFFGALALTGGDAANAESTEAEWQKGWEMFADREHVDVNLFIAGSCAGEGAKIASTVQKYVHAIMEERLDSLAWISPPREFLINLPVATAKDNIVNWRRGIDENGDVLEDNMNVSSTHIAIDGNYKYQYDKYNDRNRWVPLAADMAGLCARTDTVGQPWMSPAGFNRGQIANVIKLAIETRQPHRDDMYQNAINPVVGFSGQGYVLYGDKTGTSAPTPFDRINVRRLFNLLKKSISESAKYKLFEINDEFTRSSFTSEVSAYLDTIRSLGGIYDFRVICNETNNTPSVIDRNEFVATIMVKPARSINFITLNFVATATGADFDELVGAANLG